MKKSMEYFMERQEICDLLNKYCRALDNRDWASLASCFTPNAVAIYAELGIQQGYPAIEATCRKALERFDSSQHLIANYDIEISGDTATASCYLHAQHTKAGKKGGENLTLGGTYYDDLVRTPQGWRIRQRNLRILWQEGNPELIAD